MNLLFEAVDADWFDRSLTNPRFSPTSFLIPWATAPLAVVEVEQARLLKSCPAAVIHELFADLTMSAMNGSFPWLELELEARGDAASIYTNLFDVPAKVGIKRCMPVPLVIREALCRKCELQAYEAPEFEIRELLQTKLASPIEWVGVYDVGYGSAAAACDILSYPLIYFDLGGGALRQTCQMSLELTDFCYLNRPPVVLSHWDWYHWASGAKFKDAAGLTWIAPNQKVGVVHAAFAAMVAREGKLLVWPRGVEFIKAGAITVIRCAGRGRDNSGLALEVAGPRGEPAILLAGDANYSSIPGALSKTYTSLVPPRRATSLAGTSVPRCKRLPGARIAYSGASCSGVASQDSVTKRRHEAAGWGASSSESAVGISRETTALAPRLGHIGLSWGRALSRVPAHRCGFDSCALRFRQL